MFAWKYHLTKLHQKIHSPMASLDKLKTFDNWRKAKVKKAKTTQIKKENPASPSQSS